MKKTYSFVIYSFIIFMLFVQNNAHAGKEKKSTNDKITVCKEEKHFLGKEQNPFCNYDVVIDSWITRKYWELLTTAYLKLDQKNFVQLLSTHEILFNSNEDIRHKEEKLYFLESFQQLIEGDEETS